MPQRLCQCTTPTWPGSLPGTGRLGLVPSGSTSWHASAAAAARLVSDRLWHWQPLQHGVTKVTLPRAAGQPAAKLSRSTLGGHRVSATVITNHGGRRGAPSVGQPEVSRVAPQLEASTRPRGHHDVLQYARNFTRGMLRVSAIAGLHRRSCAPKQLPGPSSHGASGLQVRCCSWVCTASHDGSLLWKPPQFHISGKLCAAVNNRLNTCALPVRCQCRSECAGRSARR